MPRTSNKLAVIFNLKNEKKIKPKIQRESGQFPYTAIPKIALGTRNR